MIRKKKEGRDSKARPHHTKGKRSRKEGEKKTHLLLTLLLSLPVRIREPSNDPVFFLPLFPYLPPLRLQKPTEPQPQQPRPPPPLVENIPATGAHEQSSSLLTRPSSRHLRRRRGETESLSLAGSDSHNLHCTKRS